MVKSPQTDNKMNLETLTCLDDPTPIMNQILNNKVSEMILRWERFSYMECLATGNRLQTCTFPAKITILNQLIYKEENIAK